MEFFNEFLRNSFTLCCFLLFIESVCLECGDVDDSLIGPLSFRAFFSLLSLSLYFCLIISSVKIYFFIIVCRMKGTSRSACFIYHLPRRMATAFSCKMLWHNNFSLMMLPPKSSSIDRCVWATKNSLPPPTCKFIEYLSAKNICKQKTTNKYRWYWEGLIFECQVLWVGKDPSFFMILYSWERRL